MNLTDKNIPELTASELEQLGQATTWIITTLLGKVVDANAKQTSQLIVPLLAIHMDLDLARISRSLSSKRDQQTTQHGHPITYHAKVRHVWYCEGCNRVGCVGIDPLDLYASLTSINEDHTKMSPLCTKKHQNQVRVVNPAMTKDMLVRSVPRWAINHICQFLGL